jgi:DNA-binding CsgD family transcriptional regulator
VVGEGARGPGVADLLERAGLTKREREILTYWGRGHSVIYIADKLFISESTVRAHVKHIYAKLDIHSREELFELLDRS